MSAIAAVAVSVHFPHLSIIPAEIIGTAILILLGDGVVAAVLLAKSKAENSGWIVITFGWGMAVAMAVYSVGFFSGAHLNPAVTLGVWIHGGIDGAQAWKYFVGEFIGAMIGAFLVYISYYLHWRDTEDPGLKLAVFSTGPAVRNYAWNLVTEIIGTFILVFGVFAITGPWNAITSGLAPLLIGLLVFAIGLSLGGPTGYAINPARDLGPRIMHAILPIPGKGGSDWSYAWVPVLGPLIGGALAAIFFDAIFGSAPL
ncbi:MAG TPA: MIP/aquaporin family protein [Solirubrobacteraceae bacterium]